MVSCDKGITLIGQRLQFGSRPILPFVSLLFGWSFSPGLCVPGHFLSMTIMEPKQNRRTMMKVTVPVRIAFARVIASTGKSIAAAAAALAAFSLPMHAQYTISWQPAIKQPAQMTSNSSPAAVIFNNQIYVYYCDKNSNQLSAASTPAVDVKFSVLGSTGIGCGTSNTAMNGAFFPATQQVYIASNNLPNGWVHSSDGRNFVSSPINVNDTVYVEGKGLAVFQNQLWIAYVGSNGPSVAASNDGVNFTYRGTISSLIPNNPSAWQPGFSLTSNDDNSELLVAFTTGTAGFMTVGHSTDGVTWSTQQYTDQTFGHDPSIFQYQSAIWVLGQCACNDHNIWGRGSLDGVNFTAPVQYGATMNNSLSAKEFQGHLYTIFRSNYGNDLWAMWAY